MDAHEVAVLLVRQRLQRRRVEGLAARARARAAIAYSATSVLPDPVGAATSTDRPASSASSARRWNGSSGNGVLGLERARGRAVAGHGLVVVACARRRRGRVGARRVVARRSSRRWRSSRRSRSCSPGVVVGGAACVAGRCRRAVGGVGVVAQQPARPDDAGDDRGDERSRREPTRASTRLRVRRARAGCRAGRTTRADGAAERRARRASVARGWRLTSPPRAARCPGVPGRSSQISSAVPSDDRGARRRPPCTISRAAAVLRAPASGVLRAGLIVSSPARSGSRPRRRGTGHGHEQ